ncbi:hypothetical protein ACP70R_013017 [Stipagrostis hirtigluma subsp. patula]
MPWPRALEMEPPPAPFSSSSASSSSPPPPPRSLLSSNASITMVIITVVGILAAFALLASYYAFVTKCQLLRALWSRHPPWHRRARGSGGGGEASVIRAAAAGDRGLGLPLIRMLPVVKFTAAAGEAIGYGGGGGGGMAAARISVSECAVCLSEFVERERVRLLPNCSHAFHIDCIDTWLQGSARCPFCRSDVTLPAAPLPAISTMMPTAPSRHRRDDELATSNSIVIEVRGEHERWVSPGRDTPAAGRRLRRQKRQHAAESVGDEAIDTRRKAKKLEAQPLRRSLSLDSSCDKHLYVSVQDFLDTQRQVCNPSAH